MATDNVINMASQGCDARPVDPFESHIQIKIGDHFRREIQYQRFFSFSALQLLLGFFPLRHVPDNFQGPNAVAFGVGYLASLVPEKGVVRSERRVFNFAYQNFIAFFNMLVFPGDFLVPGEHQVDRHGPSITIKKRPAYTVATARL